ncbi:MAG TPA: hypothetical protein VH518_06895 [Tepidisphaeraceae bacterium]|jgi:class 3 adenylate cyclase
MKLCACKDHPSVCTLVLLCIGALWGGGCSADASAPARQDIRAQVFYRNTLTAAPEASVTHIFVTQAEADHPTPPDPVTVQMVDGRAVAQISTAMSDREGIAVIPASISTPAKLFEKTEPAADQVTGSASFFRVSQGNMKEYLADRNLRVGDQLVGKDFVLRILAIGEPKAASER